MNLGVENTFSFPINENFKGIGNVGLSPTPNPVLDLDGSPLGGTLDGPPLGDTANLRSPYAYPNSGAGGDINIDPARSFLSNSGNLAAPGIDQLFQNGNTPNASTIRDLAESQGWTRVQNPNGSAKYADENGVIRIMIKGGSQRAPGSASPHVELRNSAWTKS